MSRTKSLPLERNEAARAFTRRLLADHFGDNELKAAKRIGVSPTLLYEFLKGTRGAGMKLLNGLSAFSGESIEVITGQTSPDTESIENDPAFPHRAEAARTARQIGVSEAAIRAVLRDAGRSEADLEVKFWLGEMQRREEFLARLHAPADDSGEIAAIKVPAGKTPVAKAS